jgi:hypothetical protein
MIDAANRQATPGRDRHFFVAKGEAIAGYYSKVRCLCLQSFTEQVERPLPACLTDLKVQVARFGADRQPAHDGADATDEVADNVAGAHAVGEMEQCDAAADLDHREKDVEAHPLRGWMLFEPLSDLIVHARRVRGHVQTVRAYARTKT